MPQRQDTKLLKRALLLEYITIGWNILEGIVCILVGISTASVSLLAYGLSSGVEIFASGVVVWDLKGANKQREKIALKMIGFSYIIVAVYVFFDAIRSLLEGNHPDRTYIGILILSCSATAMIIIGAAKYVVGKKMKSATVLADAKFTYVDAALSLAVLTGLAFNTIFGFWWMDPAMAIFLAGFAFREGLREIL